MGREFYLGKEFKGDILGEKILYKSSHLTTHAVVFGMTGSGKTGLCVDLLEEAALEGIPIIAVDPKGDVSNLALVFDELSSEAFLPWISEEEALSKGKTRQEFAEEVAQKWKKGLEKWGIGEERLKEFRRKVDVRIFTPGSTAGLGVNILTGFEKPPQDFNSEPELHLDKIKNSVSSLLSILGEDTDPVKNPFHILLSSIIEHFWRQGRGVTLENLILSVQQPPIKKLGVFEVDAILPPEKRMSLALSLNNLVASPNFSLWRRGMPLDASILYEKHDKTPLNIFYIAHLSEKERMFFVSMLFNEVLSFARTLAGSSRLKYLLYMDEIYGYLPPYPFNPPSKTPLLLLLKQARAFGLGVVLVTQNPKDIDYKGLTNIGTWFIGKLQAEGDRERVLEGLEGAITSQGSQIDRALLGEILTGLKSRVFLLHDAKDTPRVFKTRWAMSYLAGPLTRRQIKLLVPSSRAIRPSRKVSGESPQAEYLSYPPNPPGGMEAFFEVEDQGSIYEPWLMAQVEVLFDEPKFGFYHRERMVLAMEFSGDKVEKIEDEVSHLPPKNAKYKPLPTDLNIRKINSLKKRLKEHLLSNLKITLFYNPKLKMISEVGEKRGDFALRVKEAAMGRFRREAEKLRERFSRKLESLERKLSIAQGKVQTLEARYKGRAAEEALSVGEILLGLALGRKATSVLTRTARRRRMTAETKHRLEDAKERLEEIKEEMVRIQDEMERSIEELKNKWDEIARQIEEYPVGLERNDIIISSLSILWRI